MPLDIFKRDVPGINDAAHAENDFRDFSSTVHAPIPVSGATEAAQIAAAAPDTAFPLFTTTGYTLWAQPSKAEERTMLAGRRSRIEADLAQAIPTGPTGRKVNMQRITHGTPGWNISSSGNSVTVPDTGLYAIQTELRITLPAQPDAPAADVGSAYVQINAGSKTFRNTASGSRAHVLGIWWLNNGDTISVHYTHNAPDQRSAWGTLIAVQLAS